MGEFTIRGKTAVAGVGETTYWKHSQSPHAEFKLALMAILAAAEDAGIDPTEIDGFASYSNDRNDPSRIAAALGCRELAFSNMQWGGGGGGGSAAIANAAAAIACGYARSVVVFRALAQGQFQRFGQAAAGGAAAGHDAFTVPYGVMSPAQRYAMRYQRFAHEHGIERSALRAISMASYHHAQQNPRAVMYGRPLSEEDYDASRWIAEPFRLFDCCQENDGAAAILLVAAERARDLPHRPCYLLGAAAGSEYRNGAPVHNAPLYGTSSFTTVAPRAFAMAGIEAADVDVAQSYENFTGGVLMSLVEHGFFAPEEANDFLTLDNLRADGGAGTPPESGKRPGGRGGKLPLNTSGGNLAECYMHGLELNIEAVRQVRGQSPNQVEGAEISVVGSGPMVTPVSSSVFGGEAAL